MTSGWPTRRADDGHDGGAASPPEASRGSADTRTLDARIDTPGREGLAGTTPASVYAAIHDPEMVTRPPDGSAWHDQPRWRRDFPIDWPEDHYVARRDFVKFTILTSFAFAVGQVWIAMQSWWRKRGAAPAAVRIAGAGAVAPGSMLSFRYPGPEDRAVLVRSLDGKLVAYGQECTHLSCAVVPRPQEGRIHCPCHEGWFDLDSGRPLAGPPRRPLDRVILEVRDGGIWATGVERRTQ